MSNPLPPPYGDPISQARKQFQGDTLRNVIDYLKTTDRGFITTPWAEFMTQQSTDISAAPIRVASKVLRDQNANIAATDISTGALAGGPYEFKWFATIVIADGVSSSLTVTLDFQYRGIAKAGSGAAITANTVGTFQSAGGLISIDSNSPVRYSTTYASNTAGVMKYDLSMTLQRINV